MRSIPLLLLCCAMLFVSGCEIEDVILPELRLLSATINGDELERLPDTVPIEVEVELLFSGALDEFGMTSALIVMPDPVSRNLRFDDKFERVWITYTLLYATDYRIVLPEDAVVGAGGRRLKSGFTADVRTVERTSEVEACITAPGRCGENIAVGEGLVVEYLTTHLLSPGVGPLDVRSAVVVLHDGMHAADAYFDRLDEAVNAAGGRENTVIVAPNFRSETDDTAQQVQWNGTDWQSGKHASNIDLSSFSVLDRLVDLLADAARFPAMRRIVFTGHAEGALLALLYAGANQLEEKHPTIQFNYLPANSQYYYYPDARRLDERSGMPYTPTECEGYERYPLGYTSVPGYLLETDREQFNARYLGRRVNYLLGRADVPDPGLDSGDCGTRLLGGSRFRRGENLFELLRQTEGTGLPHEFTVLEDAGPDDGSAVYAAPVFRELLAGLLGD